MICKCETCKGNVPQTRLWCLDHKRHVHEGHAGRNVGHKVVRFDPWPPKRRLMPVKRLTISRSLPISVDLRPFWVSAKYPQPDQGEQGCCTAETIALDIALMKLKQNIYKAPFSVAFAYAEERIDIGTFPQDSGANMVDEGIELANHGCCFESTMPYNQFVYDVTPSAAAVTEAANYKCDPNQQSIIVQDFQTAIYNSQQDPLLGSVRMGWPVPQSAMDAATNGGFVPNPSDNESILGGHSEEGAVYAMLTGPTDTAPRLYVGFIQSWGNVGDMSSGISTFWFQYPEFFNTNWVQVNGGIDAYQQRDLPTTPPPPPPAGYHNVVISVAAGSGSIQLTQPTGAPVTTNTFATVQVADGTTVTISSVAASGYTFQKYDGLGLNQAQTFQATITTDSSVGVYFLASSPCPIGNGVSSGMNFVLRRMNRRGRFFYLRVR